MLGLGRAASSSRAEARHRAVDDACRRARGRVLPACAKRDLRRTIDRPADPVELDAGRVPRTVESELRVESELADGDSPPTARVIRDIRRINGRAPRAQDDKDRGGCTDPNPLSREPLSFLLPDHRDEYVFTKVAEGREKDRATLIVDFTSANRTSRPELIEDERGHDDCSTGRVLSRLEGVSGSMRARRKCYESIDASMDRSTSAFPGSSSAATISRLDRRRTRRSDVALQGRAVQRP